MNRKQRRAAQRRHETLPAAGLDAALWRMLEAAQSCHRAGDVAGAVRQLTALVEAGHSHPYILSPLGAFQVQMGLVELGLANSRVAVERAPDDPRILINCAIQLVSCGYAGEATRLLRRAYALAPHEPSILFDLARAHLEACEFGDAVRHARRYVAECPNDLGGHRLLLTILKRTAKFDEAERYWQTVVEKFDDIPLARLEHIDLALASGEVDRARQLADEFCEQAAPHDRPSALRKSAQVHAVAGDFAPALACYEKILDDCPHDAETRHARAALLLAVGDISAGGAAFAAVSRGHVNLTTLPYPVWQGEEVNGKTVVVRSEQGIGEQILFASMIPDLLQRGAKVIVECDHRLVPLFQRSFPTCDWVGWSEPPQPRLYDPTISRQVRMGDMMRLFRSSLDDFPQEPALLRPDAALVERFGARGPKGRLRVGISWRSSSTTGGGDKSAPLAAWRDILRVPDVSFVSLQYGHAAADVRAVRDSIGIQIHMPAKLDPTHDIDALVALISSLDLVITVSNVTAHFAGAVGTPVWVLLPKSPLWHWFRGRSDSPWYSSARLYRQAASDAGWATLLGSVAADLSALARTATAD